MLGVQWLSGVDPNVLFLNAIEEFVIAFVEDGVIMVVGVEEKVIVFTVYFGVFESEPALISW